MRSAALSFTRRRAADSPVTWRELTDSERRRVPPGFEAVAEALVSGEEPDAACDVAGRTLALDGASLGEALSRLRTTFNALGGAVPSFEAVEALAVSWSEATLEFLQDVTCEDPLTGLASAAHLRTRLAEVCRSAEGSGSAVRRTHALVVVDAVAPAGTAGIDPMARALGLAAVADILRTVLAGEETIARSGTDRVVALVRRTPALGESVALARGLLDELELPRRCRIWIEGLPDREQQAVRLLSELAR